MMILYARQQKRHRCVEWTFGLRGRGRGWDDLGECIEICILSCKNRIASLCPMQDTACLGLVTQRDVMGREVEGGFMFGNACTPVVDSCQCMAKSIQYCKVKK